MREKSAVESCIPFIAGRRALLTVTSAASTYYLYEGKAAGSSAGSRKADGDRLRNMLLMTRTDVDHENAEAERVRGRGCDTERYERFTLG